MKKWTAALLALCMLLAVIPALGEGEDVSMQGLETRIVLYQFESRRDQLLCGICIFDEYCGIFPHEGHGVMRLMVLCHIRRRHEYGGFAEQA